MAAQGLGDDGFEGQVDEFLDQGGRGVVAAGELALVAGQGLLAVEAGKVEAAVGEVQARDEFQQALVDAAQLLAAHVAVVDGDAVALVDEGAELAHRFEQGAVGQVGALEVGALVGLEQTAEGRQGQAGLAAAQQGEEGAQAAVEVVVALLAAVAEGAGAQAGDGEDLAVAGAGGGTGVDGVEQVALLEGD